MIDIEKLKPILDGYIAYFPNAWNGEKYKWQAVKCFQDNWNIDAKNFEEMLSAATDKASNLLSSINFYPRKMILSFAHIDAEATRAMFRKLYDEEVDLSERIKEFQVESETLRVKLNDDKWKNHFQNTNAISTYLWLRYPDKYYIYKYELASKVAKELDSDNNPKANGTAQSMIEGFHLYDDICEVVKNDDRIRDMIDRFKTESCYDDPKMKTATIDVVFYMKRFIIDESKERKALSKKERTVSEAIKLVLNDTPEGLTAEQIYNKIIENNLYEFNARDPKGVVVSTIRSSCEGVDNKYMTRDKEFVIVKEEGNEVYYALNNSKISNVVNTWLLNWNPSNKGWNWEEQDDEFGYNNTVKTIKSGGTVFFCWKCVSKQIKTGDRIFMVKLGDPPRGIFATGYAASDTYDSTYTDDNGEEATERVVDICITGFWDYHTDDLISQDFLKSKFPDQQWSPQGSGISIKPEAARWLIDNWNSFGTKTDVETSAYDNSSIDPSEFRSNSRYKRYFIPLTEALYNAGGAVKRTDAHKMVIDMLNISEEELSQGSKTHDSVVINDIDWARNYLNYEGFIDSNAPNGIWALSDIGKKYEMTEELAEKIIVKWVKITTARRKGEPEPTIDLTPYYKLRTVKYTKQDFLKDVYMSESKYDELKALLENKMNVILQGAPGVGKTFTAKRLAYSIIGEKDDSRIEFIQFHQNYSYEDFIMGYRPIETGGFKLEEGVFYRFCEKARNDTSNRPYFFIIDEINRGNLSKIFGELLMLIEKDYRKESAKLAYRDDKFTVPDNLYIIGMMNTADRSLALIDYALRRRFSFFEMEPGFDSDGFKKYAEELHNTKFDELIKKIVELNKAITDDKSLGKGFRIGHSYFCGRSAENCTDEWLRSVVKYDIIPTLEEYWFDDMDKVSDWENKLNGALND